MVNGYDYIIGEKTMTSFMQVTEGRMWPSHSLTVPTSVTANEEIVNLTTLIENAEVSIINVATVFSTAGKLYYIDESGNENYLTDSTQNYPAKYTIIASFFLKKGKTISLRYSTDATMHHLYVTHGAGVF